MKKLIIKYFLILVFSAAPFFSNAWGLLGHRVVGEIAQSYLTPKAKLEIRKILGNETLAMTSNWMDFIKSDTSYNYLYNWHFINFKQGLTDAAIESYLLADTAVDAYVKMKFMIAELKKKNLTEDKKKLYLRALVHIIGDIHQPMHVGQLEDQGGNRVKLSWFNEPSNLHRVWDDDLITSQRLSFTEYVAAINFTTKDQRKKLQAAPMSQWILESYKQAGKIYAGVKADDKLSYRYIFDYLDIANERLLTGGVRLAGVLNDIYK